MNPSQQTPSGKRFLEPSLSVVSRVEKEQFEDGSLDKIIVEELERDPVPTTSDLILTRCQCATTVSGSRIICDYCSDPTIYGIVARAFDTRELDSDQDPCLDLATRDLGLLPDLFPPPPLPRANAPLGLHVPSSYNEIIDPSLLPSSFFPSAFDLNFDPGILTTQDQQTYQEAPGPEDEHIRRMLAEQEQDSVTQTRYSRSPSAGTSFPRNRDPQSGEQQSRLISTPGVSQAAYSTSDGQNSDCYSCNRPNSWENMVACDGDHGLNERWFHVSCAGLTMATLPFGDEKWWCQDCSTPDGVYEIDETLYQDDSAELTGRGDFVRSGQNYKGKRKQDPHSRESTPLTDSHDSDDNDESNDSDDSDDRDDSDNSDDTSGSNQTRKRKREQELELTESSTSSEGDDSDDSTYSGNSHKRRRQPQSKAKRIFGAKKGLAQSQSASAPGTLTVPNSSTATMPDSHDNNDGDDISGSNKTRKRMREQEVEFVDDSTTLDGDDSDDSAYSGNSRKRSQQLKSKAKRGSGFSKGPARLRSTSAPSIFTVQKSTTATTPARAAQTSPRSQPPDKFPPPIADKVYELMKEVVDEKQFNEKKFQLVSERLAERHGIELTHGAIKNYWNRKGRATYQLDERKRPNPNKMVTGVQSPEARRKARQQSKANTTSANGRKRQKRD